MSVLGDFLNKENYDVTYASSFNNKLLRILDMIKACLSQAKSVDLVLIDTYSTQNFYYAFIISQLCRALRLPYVPILHGGNLPQRLKLHPRKSRMLFKHAKINVAPSLYLKHSFENNGINNVIHIPNSIDIDKYPFTIRTYNSLKLLWVRSFSKIYNPKLAVMTYKSLKEIYPNAELCMVGPDSDGTLNEIKSLVKDLNLEVKLTGKLSKEDWINLSQSYNVFINTTNFDNMPLSLMETMALGLPIVSTNVGGIPFLIKDKTHGVLVEPENIDEMVEAIKLIFTDESLRSRIIKNARDRSEHLDWKHIKTSWFEILE